MSDTGFKDARILIVDDQRSNIDLLEGVLRKQGYSEFSGLTDSRQVVATFHEWQPDLILLDLMMPHMDGFTVMEALKPLIVEDDYLPILVLTADVTAAARQRALSGGAVDFLTKPLDVAEVAARVRNLLHTRALHLRLQDQNEVLEQRVCERTAELFASETRYRTLVETSPDGIVLTDLEGSLTLCNRQATLLHGYEDPVAMHGINVLDLVAEPERAAAIANARETLDRGSMRNIEYMLLRRDASSFPAEVSTAVIRGADGDPMSFVRIERDITDRKQVEQLKNEFIETISHELRTPLTVILGYGDLLSCPDTWKDMELMPRMVSSVLERGEQMRWLIEDLLESVAAHRDRIELHLVPVDVAELVSECTTAATRTSARTVSLVVANDMPRVWCDRTRMGRVITNVLSNAVKFSPDGGPVRVEVWADGGRALVRVSDEGIGIPSDVLPHVFGQFYQRDMSSTREFGGTGMGLFIARRLVQAHGGRIEAESEEGEGSVFTIEVPVGGREA